MERNSSMDRKLNLGLAAVAVGSIATMVILSIHGLAEREKAREIARLPVVKMEAVTIVGERPGAPASTQVARGESASSTRLR